MKALILVLSLWAAVSAGAADTLPALVGLLGRSSEPQVTLDVLRGLRDAMQGRQRVPMPAGWEAIEPGLIRNADGEIRMLARSLGLTFGSEAARIALGESLRDRSADPAERQAALRSLAAVRDPSLPATLRGLLGDPALRGAAVRALAAYEDPENATALLAAYPALAGSERRDALTTMSARPAEARALLAAVGEGKVSARDLTAEIIRQLRSLKDEQVNDALAKVYGTVREVAADKQAEIERYRRLYWAGGSTPGDAIRGRTVYARVCQQCHVLFGTGGHVGPDLTGSNRGDLDYVLQNILDPNAVIPNEYRASTLDLKDGRVVTGIVQQQDGQGWVVATANETLRIARSEVESIQESQLSMMPEGLVAPLSDQEFRDLVYYLGRPGQTPLSGTPETANLFFNGIDLALWQGDEALWSVEGGEIVGRSASGLKENAFLASEMILGDFRLTVRVKLSPNSENSGIQFRSEPLPDGSVKGYQADIGAGWWGKLYEEHGRALLWDRPGDAHVRAGEWNEYEILAVGSRIRTAINGHPCVDLDDPAGARQGVVALQLHSGGPIEVRFRDLRLELNPEPMLKTVGR